MTKEIVQIPTCPFCGLPIDRPEIFADNPDISLGRCSCGAIYACDESGKNLGSAFIEALVFACNGNWDRAWELSEDKDFKTEVIEHYDPISHLIVPGGVFDKRRVVGALYFVRLNIPVEDIGSKIRVLDSKKESLGYRGKSLSKRDVEELISSYNIRPIIERAGKDRRLIKNLQRLLYSANPVIRARTAEALGKVCAVISKKDPKQVSRLVQTLLYSIVDSATFSLGSFEAIAEIIANAPDLYEAYVPYLYQFISEESRRAKTIMALARIAEVKPGLLRGRAFYFLRFLNDKDPEVRGYTVILLEKLRASEMKEDIARLKGDMYKISIYENGEIIYRTIDELVSIALNRL